jgi:hypothetical protein
MIGPVSDCWAKCRPVIEARIKAIRDKVADDFGAHLSNSLAGRIAEEKRVYEARIHELDTEKSSKAIEKLRKELLDAERRKNQITFNEELNRENQERYTKLLTTLAELEWERRNSQITMLKGYLSSEEKRIIEKVLPQRYALSTVDVQPAAMKIIVNGGRA